MYKSHRPWAAFVLFLFRFTFFRLSIPFFKILLYSSINLGTSSCDTAVESFFDDDFARIKHLYSSGSGNGGRPSRGFGRSCPSSANLFVIYFHSSINHFNSHNKDISVFVSEFRKYKFTYIVSKLEKTVLIYYLHYGSTELIELETEKKHGTSLVNRSNISTIGSTILTSLLLSKTILYISFTLSKHRLT